MTFANLVSQIVGLFNTLIPILVGLAMIMFFIGLVRYISDAGDVRGRTRGRETIVWGLVAMFVLMSLWGILEVAKNSLFP